MEQYFNLKSKHPDAILLFRVGDFYETFGEDAVKTADVLGIVLTSRNNGGSDIPLAGFPYHSLDTYLPKLVRGGFRVAICEQLEKPSKEKKIVKRGVTDMVTPGLTIEDTILDKKSNNYLASLYIANKDNLGIAFLDISTGEFLVSQGNFNYIEKLLHSFSPSEIIYDKSKKSFIEKKLGDSFYVYPQEEWIYTEDYTVSQLKDHFKVTNFRGYGIDHLDLAKFAAGAALHYLSSTQNDKLRHISRIARIQSESYMWLDRFTIKNLELVTSVHDTGKPLLQVLDHTISPMGARLMRKWVILPLLDIDKINKRLEAIEYLNKHDDLSEILNKQVKKIGDLERLGSKLAMERISPRELLTLKDALSAIIPIKKTLTEISNSSLKLIGEKLYDSSTIINKIEKSIHPEAPAVMSKGTVIADNFHKELDELRGLIRNSKEILMDIQRTEAEKTGITNLKIGFNNVFGYYLEVTNKFKNQGLIPDNWVRKQTLTGSERYITEELKTLESKILGAEDKILALEEVLFGQIIAELVEFLLEVQQNATTIAELDCLQSLSTVARKNNYCKPTIDDSHSIHIIQGRHAVIEQELPLDEQYVPNDIFLDDETIQIMMITGPNMSGKSALLRQTALTVIMAQMGSFVPATKANIGIVDKVFTRVGASDNISSGESTFMLEMNETASIMNNISDRSLILLDEIGRGTSTYDGISIAWALAEFLHNHHEFKPKTLFATHYHELNELAGKYGRIKNYNIAVRELNNTVIFLRKLEAGGCEHSFGIHVAQMAGMPFSIIARANEILHELEQKSISKETKTQKEISNTLSALTTASSYQMSIFETNDPSIAKLKEVLDNVNINNMTPIDCMLKLKELQEILGEE
jgi:DNA mismatch repair protein MutS